MSTAPTNVTLKKEAVDTLKANLEKRRTQNDTARGLGEISQTLAAIEKAINDAWPEGGGKENFAADVAQLKRSLGALNTQLNETIQILGLLGTSLATTDQEFANKFNSINTFDAR